MSAASSSSRRLPKPNALSPISTKTSTDSSTPTSTAISSLTFPSVVFKGSFANLIKAIKGDHSIRRASVDSEEDEEEEEEEEDEAVKDALEGEVDEDSLMWDAQTALVAHHLDLAVKLYTQAALPPYRSPSACLALGNLLIRGSTLAEHDGLSSPPATSSASPSSPLSSSSRDVKGKSKASTHDISPTATHTHTSSVPSFFSRLFGSPPAVTRNPDSSEWKGAISTSQQQSQLRPEPVRRGTTDLVASGWQIPREGKRAVRDPKAMGVAAAWFILGLGWLVQEQSEREEKEWADRKLRDIGQTQADKFLESIPDGVLHRAHTDGGDNLPEDEVLLFGPKSKPKLKPKSQLSQPAAELVTDATSPRAPAEIPDGAGTLHESSSTITASGSTATLCPPASGPSSSSGRTTESPMIQTPGIGLEGQVDPFARHNTELQYDEDALQQMLELLSPLVHLYRHGHIQAQDPVSLPPISLQQLPAPLKPKNETDKRRNVWHLGRVLSSRMMRLDLLSRGAAFAEGRETETARDGEDKLRGAVYILTNYILAMTSRDYEAEVYFRNVIATSSTGITFADDLIRQAAKRLDILTSTPRDESGLNGFPFPQTNISGEAETSKSSRPHQNPDYYLSPPKAFSKASPSGRRGSSPTISRDIPSGLSSSPADTLRPVASSPQIGSLRLSHLHKHGPGSLSSSELPDNETDTGNLFTVNRARTNPSTPRRKLPFEPSGEIAPIDPSLAAAELSSALTKHVMCGVCGGSGVNFPECRKCGLTFCSRDCRIGEDKAGNGKKHICGAWESRRLLTVPTRKVLVSLNKSSINVDVEKPPSSIRATRVF
ncbi:hypothetical protein I317_03316 [Kwoniella heveanensis CBS 569]|nr:hypothetical protein I317_03316 [Kwoniella heveanensis CBS 569]